MTSGSDRRALIVGATGVAGRHLRTVLADAGYEVHGTSRAPARSPSAGWLHATPEVGRAEIWARIIETVRPGAVFFLLSAPHAAKGPEFVSANLSATWAFVEALATATHRPRMLLASSSAVYGLRDDPEPLDEDAPLAPAGDYGIAKRLQEELALHYHRRHGLDVVVARPTNHPAPGERLGLVCTDYARAVVEIERGSRPAELRVRDPANQRDFVDARDVARAYLALITHGRPGTVYNVASSRPVKIEAVVRRLAAMSTATPTVLAEVEGARANAQVLDATRLRRETGWEPVFDLDRTLRDVLEFRRARSER